MPYHKGEPLWKTMLYNRFGNTWYEVLIDVKLDGTSKVTLGKNKFPELEAFIEKEIEKAQSVRKYTVREKKDQFALVKCSYCGKDKSVPISEYKQKQRRGSKQFYCTGKCFREANRSFWDRIKKV